MTELTLLFIIAFLAGALIWAMRTARKNPPSTTADQSLVLLQGQINELSRALDLKLGESTKAIQHQFGESTKIIREITSELTKVNEGQKQVLGITDQLKNLQDILKNPKQRGVLGEYYLQTVLENVLPPGSYQMQYEFKDGTIVDAVVFARDKVIPIDSKFSLENYNRLISAKDPLDRSRYEDAFRNDLKGRIDETSKYIKPDEGTMDFAFMFIPSEAIYYDLLVNKVGAASANARDLVSYATTDKKVIIVSPTSFLAYLQTVMQGLKALQIEESAKEIRQRVEELGRHLLSFETYMKKMGRHLGATVGSYDKAYKELGKIDKDVLRIGGEAMNIEPLRINVPVSDEE